MYVRHTCDICLFWQVCHVYVIFEIWHGTYIRDTHTYATYDVHMWRIQTHTHTITHTHTHGSHDEYDLVAISHVITYMLHHHIHVHIYRKITIYKTNCAWHWWSLGQDNASAIVLSHTRMFSPPFRRRLSVGKWNEEHAHGKTTTQSWSPPN